MIDLTAIAAAEKHFESLQRRYTTTHNGKHCELVHAALACLRECAERREGCEFCRKPYKSIDSGKGGKEKSILYMGGNSPYVQLSKQYLHYMDVVGRMDLFEVKFCPMCGRKLERSDT